jgi:hypothetical protein
METVRHCEDISIIFSVAGSTRKTLIIIKKRARGLLMVIYHLRVGYSEDRTNTINDVKSQ